MAGIKEIQDPPESLAGEPAGKDRQPHPYFTQELKDQLFPPLENMRVPPKERRKIYMAEEDLGSMMPLGSAQPTGGEPLPIKGSSQPRSWSQMVSDPVMSAGLMAAGLSMMRGGYGTMGQQIAQAGSEGMTAAGNTAGHILENQRNERDFAAKEHEGEANRKSHEKIAEMGATSRAEVANIRVEGMLERSRLIHGPQNNQEMKIVSDAANKYMTAQENQAILSKLTPAQRNEMALAWGKQVLQQAREASGVRSQGAPLPNEPAGASPAATSGAQAPTPPAGQAAATTQSAPKPSWDQIKDTPLVKKLMSTPAGKRTLLNERPDLSEQILKDVPVYGN